MTDDRRAGNRNVPHEGKQPRSRTKTGTWRRKRDSKQNKETEI